MTYHSFEDDRELVDGIPADLQGAEGLDPARVPAFLDSTGDD
jgi:hypothetical protein